MYGEKIIDGALPTYLGTGITMLQPRIPIGFVDISPFKLWSKKSNMNTWRAHLCRGALLMIKDRIVMHVKSLRVYGKTTNDLAHVKIMTWRRSKKLGVASGIFCGKIKRK